MTEEYVSRNPFVDTNELLGFITDPVDFRMLQSLSQTLGLMVAGINPDAYTLAVKLVSDNPRPILLRIVRPWENEHPGVEIRLAWKGERPPNDLIDEYRHQVAAAIASLQA